MRIEDKGYYGKSKHEKLVKIGRGLGHHHHYLLLLQSYVGHRPVD